MPAPNPFPLFFMTLSLWGMATYAFSQPSRQPGQPASGPGGSDYAHKEVIATDSAQSAGGFWIFEPSGPRPDTAQVVVFLHGFGCFNPMIYGKWIRHLAAKGNVVIAPRYQTGLWVPKRTEFTDTAAHAIRNAIRYLEQNSTTRLRLDRPVYIGHSYGGVLAANLAVRFAELGVPKPAALMLCQPGTNLFPGGRLRSYGALPHELKVLIVVAQNDLLVSRRFANKIYRATAHVAARELLIMRRDGHGRPPLAAGHRACHATDPAFDNGVRTFSARYALLNIPTDAADYHGFWKLADALIDCTLYNRHCDTAFGGSEAQLGLGVWSDGVKVKQMKRK